MDGFANENNPLRFDIEGGEMYLPFAKNKLREMKHLMAMRDISFDNRVIGVDGAEILIKSMPGFDYISIIATPRKPGVMLIYIRNTSREADGYQYELIYDTSGNKKGKDYRVLLYRRNDSNGSVGLSPDGLMGDGLSISDTGLTLCVQSGDGVYAAQLPSIFAYNETIDYAEFMPTSWSSTLLVLDKQRVVGSSYVSNWSKTQSKGMSKYVEDPTQFISLPGSRHAYTSGRDGYVTGCMFKNQQELLGTGAMYRELSLFPEDGFYQLWKNEVVYKATPEDKDYIVGTLIGSDYITGTPWQTGYNWMTWQVIDIFDKDNALVKIVSNTIPKGGTVQYPYTLNLTVDSRWYLDRTPPIFSATSDTWIYNGQTAVNDTTCERIERLMVGDIEIENVQYVESVYDSNRLDWIPGSKPAMTLVASSGSAKGGFGDGAISASGSVTGSGKFNATLKVESFLNTSTGRGNIRLLPISIGESHKATKSGYRDIHVTAFDNMNGADYFIIIYKKSYVYFSESSDTPNVNDGTIPTPITSQISKPTVTSYYIAYKTKDGGLIKAGLAGDIAATSCQINNGYMAYTYCTFENGAFVARTIGMIDIATGTKNEWETDDNDARLSGFQHDHHAAIGIL
ncbi:MAG: hypothetical protein HQK95_07525 [Nitrospirae bacterium]|nr:hypothetical protein [Nitrospirota bacterium]